MDLVLDASPCAVNVDPNVLHVLRHGIDQESQFKICETLRVRRERDGEGIPGRIIRDIAWAWLHQTSVKASFLAIEKRRSNSVEICSMR
jgi:hypothetical protein